MDWAAELVLDPMVPQLDEHVVEGLKRLRDLHGQRPTARGGGGLPGSPKTGFGSASTSGSCGVHLTRTSCVSSTRASSCLFASASDGVCCTRASNDLFTRSSGGDPIASASGGTHLILRQQLKVIKVLSQNRVQQLVLELLFVVEVFSALSQDRVQQLVMTLVDHVGRRGFVTREGKKMTLVAKMKQIKAMRAAP